MCIGSSPKFPPVVAPKPPPQPAQRVSEAQLTARGTQRKRAAQRFGLLADIRSSTAQRLRLGTSANAPGKTLLGA